MKGNNFVNIYPSHIDVVRKLPVQNGVSASSMHSTKLNIFSTD